jgi:hypothetical protein
VARAPVDFCALARLAARCLQDDTTVRLMRASLLASAFLAEI